MYYFWLQTWQVLPLLANVHSSICRILIVFSGRCILRVWHHASVLQPCKCPICRRLITLLVPTDAALSQCNDLEASQVLEDIKKYNRQFGGAPNSLGQVYFLYIPTSIKAIRLSVYDFPYLDLNWMRDPCHMYVYILLMLPGH